MWLWLWLWDRLAAVAPIHPLASELPYAMGAALKSKKKKKKKDTQCLLKAIRRGPGIYNLRSEPVPRVPSTSTVQKPGGTEQAPTEHSLC